jgi:hypothetical protein
VEKMHYILKDHLGSIMVITNQSGAKEEEFSYDAWGNRRNPSTWGYTGLVNLAIEPNVCYHSFLFF